MRAVLLFLITSLPGCILQDEVGHNDGKAEAIPTGKIQATLHTIEGEAFGTMGFANAFVGDLDGDGFDDFAIADRDYTLGDNGGRTYLFYGRSDFDQSLSVLDADCVFEAGWESIRRIGDLDSDGFDELAFVGTDARAAHLVYGSDQRMSGVLDPFEAGSTFSSPAGQRIFTMNGAGDINGDGRADLSFETLSTDGSASAAFYLVESDGDRFATSLALEDVAAATFSSSQQASVRIGSSGVGDLDGDGFADVLVAFGGSGEPVSASLFYGGANVFAGAMNAASGDAHFSLSTSWLTAGPIGDLNADGIGDLLFASGRSFQIFYGEEQRFSGSVAEDDADFSVLPENAGNAAANFSGLGVGDVDADGNLDLLIGDPSQDRNGVQAGALYLVLGASYRFDGSLALSEAHALLYGKNLQSELDPGLGEDLGYGVASGADVNGDGFDDILAGAPGDVSGDERNGTVYLFLGGSRTHNCGDCGGID